MNCKLEMKCKILMEEREKMISRIEKLKVRGRRFKVDTHKICSNCRKEYRDQDNFNWSCRVHRSEWSGVMWWCCGKSSRDAPGCKFGKHIVQEEED